MYRIGAITACAAALVCISFNAAWAANCDQRVADSCPIEPIVEAADAATESVTPLAYARTGREPGVRRARRASRYSRRVERRRPAKVVQVARMREPAPLPPPPRPEIAEEAIAPAPATVLPTVAAILPPTFVRDANLDGSKLEAGWNAVHAPQAAMDGASEPAEPRENSGQATARSSALAQVADNAAETGPRRTEPAQAAAAGAPEPVETPWMRFAIMAFGGLLALGSAIRMFV